ncbi:MAG TPA: NAD-dependent epimerase/dehydratase family protein [Gemmatimonas sp.]|uniref:NAD-dependent epimerase/dehydratase family protein n=1 Tax=Gemmatimonas sp. TaxID=1962908 RepID=UPI002EDAC7E7
MTRTVLLGPGWLGAPTAQHLAAMGHQTWVVGRQSRPARFDTVTSDAASIPPIVVTADLLSESGSDALRHDLPAAADHLVVCVAPATARGEDYAVYPRLAAASARLANQLGVRSVVYVSSTGIYDRTDGSLVDEYSPIVAESPRVRALLDAEEAIASAGSARCAVHVLRVAGLYGPGRDPSARFRSPPHAPTALSGRPADSDTLPNEEWCNFAWRDDVIAAIAHLLALTTHDAVHVFNCADGHPVRANEITAALPPLPHDAPQPSPRRARSNQRISVNALRATGWIPAVPTIFHGLQLLGHPVPLPSELTDTSRTNRTT